MSLRLRIMYISFELHDKDRILLYGFNLNSYFFNLISKLKEFLKRLKSK